MKTLLRNHVTGNYFQGVNDWTPLPEQAFNFQCPERAVRFVLRAELNTREMEVILAFNDLRYTISLPVDGRFGMAPAAGGQAARRKRAPAHSEGIHNPSPADFEFDPASAAQEQPASPLHPSMQGSVDPGVYCLKKHSNPGIFARMSS